jgi:molecular chaperone GrpE
MADRTPKGPSPDDDRYVIEDTGDSIQDIEHEMEVAAQEADDTISRRKSHPGNVEVPETPAAEPPTPDASEWKNRYMRTLADFENFRKRTERDKQDFQKYAMANVMRDLLPVLDNFDRALDHAEEGDDFHKGVLMIYKQLYDILQKHGLKPIEQSGVAFDPNIHEGVMREEDTSVPSGTVTAILQKGYFLHDRLLRPAMVKVSSGGPDRSNGVQ